MKLLLLGATGTTGQTVLAEALKRGHSVTVLVRESGSLPNKMHPQLTVVKGSFMHSGCLGNVVAGHDAVLLVAGSNGNTMPLTKCTANLVWQMNVTGVSRLLVLSRQGAGASRKQMGTWWHWATRFLNRAVFEDHDQQEETVRQSGLAWTIVRPTDMSNSAPAGYVAAPTRQQLPASAQPRIARADVASFLLDQLIPSAPTRCALSIAGAAVRQPAREPRTSGQLVTG